MKFTKAYVALGGNIGDSRSVLANAVQSIAELPEVHNMAVSRFYSTAPISPVPQARYVNAVCCFDTAYGPKRLFNRLQEIEARLGKLPKDKTAPRIIDLDLLFFGNRPYHDSDLEIPHPRWHERLFVLAPLADLAAKVILYAVSGERRCYDISSMIDELASLQEEAVVLP